MYIVERRVTHEVSQEDGSVLHEAMTRQMLIRCTVVLIIKSSSNTVTDTVM